jgi:uncharacterized membrane protein
MTTTDWVALTTLPRIALVLLGVMLLGYLWMSWRGMGAVPARTRVWLMGLRSMAAIALFVLVLEPGWVEREVEQVANRVLIVIDDSTSMNSGTPTRASTAAALGARVVERLSSRNEVQGLQPSWAFVSDGLRATTSEEVSARAAGAAATGRQTKLAELAELSSLMGSSQQPLLGVVLLSDGNDTTEWTTMPQALQNTLQQMKRDGVPLHTVVLGEARQGMDVRVADVQADEFAFVRNPLLLTATIHQRGFDGQQVQVLLKEDGRTVSEQRVVLAEADTKVVLRHEPNAVGAHVYSVVVGGVVNDEIPENNRLDVPIQVIRDRIRVLQVAGRPSWDERFVRRLLKDNPSVDLISFFILRSTTDVSGAPNAEMSLIPFPTEELFTQQLHTFDVVIFQDFNYRPYGMAPYLEDVRTYVEGGGGFIMIGGDLSFSDGDYADTPIAEILPVRLLPGRDHIQEDGFHPLLTDAGKNHPVVDVGVGFTELPALQGINTSAGLVPGAIALLAHDSLTVDSAPMPLLAIREVGKGRSMALLTDSTWMWGLPHVGAGGRGDAHRRLLANALRWLIRDPQLARLRIVLDQRRTEPGVPVGVRVHTFDERYQPMPGGVLHGTWTSLESESDGASPAASIPFDARSGEDGTWSGSFTPPTPGVYRVRVEGKSADDTLGFGSAEDVVVVRSSSVEALHEDPQPERLRMLAEVGGGQAVDASHVDDLVFPEVHKEHTLKQSTKPAWPQAPVLLLVVMLLAVEWWLRRKAGLA